MVAPTGLILSERVTRFARLLRAAGLSLGPGQLLKGLEALAPACQQCHVGPGAGEGQGDGPTDVAAGTGHGRPPAGEGHERCGGIRGVHAATPSPGV